MKKTIIFLTVLIAFASALYAQQADFTSNPVCYGEHTTFVGNINLPDSLITGYYWDFDQDGFYDDAFGKNVTHIFSAADTFLVGVLVVANGGVEYTMGQYKETIVYPVPDVNFHVDNLCQGEPAVFTDQSTVEYGSFSQFYWDFNNDGTPDNVAGGNKVEWVCGPAGNYVTRLTVITDHNCSAFTTKSIAVYSQPTAQFSATDACALSEVYFSNSSSVSGDQIAINYWIFGDGEVSSNTNPSHAYENDGTFQVQLVTVTSNNCRDTIESSITIMPMPQFSIEYTPDTIADAGNQISLGVTSGFSQFEWSTNSTNQSIDVSQEGLYSVTVTNDFGCTGTASQYVYFVSYSGSEQSILVSNVLTPNGDGINDYLEIVNLEDYSTVSVVIYNMAGREIFSSNNYNNEWDGTANSKVLDSGAYYLVVSLDGTQTTANINILK